MKTRIVSRPPEFKKPPVTMAKHLDRRDGSMRVKAADFFAEQTRRQKAGIPLMAMKGVE